MRHVVAAGRDGRALRQALEVGHGAVHGAGVDPLPRRVGGLRPVAVDDLVLVLARRFPPLPVQQEEVDDLLRVVAAGRKGALDSCVWRNESKFSKGLDSHPTQTRLRVFPNALPDKMRFRRRNRHKHSGFPRVSLKTSLCLPYCFRAPLPSPTPSLS